MIFDDDLAHLESLRPLIERARAYIKLYSETHERRCECPLCEVGRILDEVEEK